LQCVTGFVRLTTVTHGVKFIGGRKRKRSLIVSPRNLMCVWHDSFTCVPWLIHNCDMTHFDVGQNSFICATWLIHTCGMTRSHVRHDSYTIVTLLFHACDITHTYTWHNSYIASFYMWCVSLLRATWLMDRVLLSFMWRIHTYDMTRRTCSPVISYIASFWSLITKLIAESYVWHDSFMCETSFIRVTRLIHIWATIYTSPSLSHTISYET